MKKIMAIITAALTLVMTGTACGTSANAANTPAGSETAAVFSEDTMIDYIPNSENVKLIGRTSYQHDMLMLAFSGSGAEFTFNGKKAEITIKGDSSALTANNEGNYARIAIYVNGEPVVDDQINAPEKTYTVFESETNADADVRIVKLSETAMSTVGIKKISVMSTAGIKPAAEKDLKIEFIGDSITCGYGVDDEDKEHHFSTATEDVTKAYAYKTAQALNADYSMVSISGYGIISGYSGDGVKHPEQSIPQYYTKLGFSYGTLDGVKPSDVDWDFSKFTPDIVVVNLGTNDDSYCGTDSAKKEEYASAYVDFLKVIREKNPNAKIVCALGIMGQGLCDYVELAAYNYTEETGDKNISTLKFDAQDPANGYAADWHPTEKTHDLACAQLTEALKKLIG